MPKVQKYGASRVSQQVASQPRLPSVRAIDSSQPISQGLAGLGRAFEIQEDRQSTTEADAAVVAFDRWKNNLLTGTDGQGYNTTGKTAFDNKQALDDEYTKGWDNHFGDLSYGAKEKARARFESAKTNDSAKMAIHAQSGFDTHEVATQLSTIESAGEQAVANYTDRAITDDYVKQAIQTSYKMEMKRTGSEEAAQEAAQTAAGSIVAGMIDEALSREDIAGAEDILSSYSDVMGVEGGMGAAQEKIRKAQKTKDEKDDDAVYTQKALDISNQFGNDIQGMMSHINTLSGEEYSKTVPKLMAIVRNNKYAENEATSDVTDEVEKIYNEQGAEGVKRWALENKDSWDMLTGANQKRLTSGQPRVTTAESIIALRDAVTNKTLTGDMVKQLYKQNALSKADLESWYKTATEPKLLKSFYSIKDKTALLTKDLDDEQKLQFMNSITAYQAEKFNADEELDDDEIYAYIVGKMAKGEATWWIFGGGDHAFESDTDTTARDTVYAERLVDFTEVYGDQTKTELADHSEWIEEWHSDNGGYPSRRDVEARYQQQMTEAGVLSVGNIDLNNHQPIQNSDGTFSTIETISITDDAGNVILIPTVYDGQRYTEAQAVKRAHDTGLYIAAFGTEEQATDYAEKLSARQGEKYAPSDEDKEKIPETKTEVKVAEAQELLGMVVEVPPKEGEDLHPIYRKSFTEDWEDAKAQAKAVWLNIKTGNGSVNKDYGQNMLKRAERKEQTQVWVSEGINQIKSSQLDPEPAYELARRIARMKDASKEQVKWANAYITVYKASL